MKKLSVITMCFLMLLVTGCSQNKSTSSKQIDKSKWKDISDNISADMKETFNKKQSADNEDKASSNNDEKNDESVDQNNNASMNQGKQKNESTTSNESSNTNSKEDANGEVESNVKHTPTPAPAPKPTPVPVPTPDPTPPPVVCDNTIPIGAYLSEDEAATYAEKLIDEKLKSGEFSNGSYDIETGATKCGTKYYILTIKLY